MIFQKEADFEEAVIKVLKQHGWDDAGGVIQYPTEEDLIQNWANILYDNNRQIDRLNGAPLTRTEMAQVIEQVEQLRTPLALNGFINGKTISIKRDNPEDRLHLGKEISLKIYDRREIAGGQSRYQIVQQPVYPAKNKMLNDRRGDLCLLINGMPVIHIELKRSGTSVEEACHQIEKYAHEGVFSGIFRLAQIFVAMTPDEALYFANPGNEPFNESFFFHWADFNNEPICAGKEHGQDAWQDFVVKLLSIPMAHQLIGFYTVADSGDGRLKVMRSYQYYAASSISSVVKRHDWDAPNPTKIKGRSGGFIWHTTGSGKTMTSFKSAQLIADSGDADKVVFLMDRIELGTQSLREYRGFADNADDVQATENTNDLRSKLIESTDPKDTLIVTSIQKLSRVTEEKGGITKAELKRMEDKRVVFIVDECHRSTFGTMLMNIRKNFPNALYFGFTGTPIQEENQKMCNTTSTIFGDCLHRYSLADGIRDKNVLGFDVCMIPTYREDYLRRELAFEKLRTREEREIFNNPAMKDIWNYYLYEIPIVAEENPDGRNVRGIEDRLKPVQYSFKTKHPNKVVESIREKFPMLSRGNKMHAIFATSSISDAIEYYRMLKEEAPEIRCTALFDSNIDNKEGNIFKEDALVEIIQDYNERYKKDFSIPTQDSMKRDIVARLSHKKPYLNIADKPEERLDLLIVVDQMLTGFDSKWVNTLYLDKVLEYESIIQAFSRTNRILNPSDKPFGTICYYRKPYTMRKNIKKAVALYSGEERLPIFVQKLPDNIKAMNEQLQVIKAFFKVHDIPDMSSVPENKESQRKFVTEFRKLAGYVRAGELQGFVLGKQHYSVENENGEETEYFAELDKRTFRILLKRYNEAKSTRSGNQQDIPYNIDGVLLDGQSERIDIEYMNSNFKKWYKALLEDDPNIDKLTGELHRTFAALSQEEQRFADIIINDIQRGDFTPEQGKTLRDYITEYAHSTQEDQLNAIVDAFGVDKDLLKELIALKLNKANLNEFGRFDKLKDSVDNEKAYAYLEKTRGENLDFFKRKAEIYNYLERFVLKGDLELD